MPVGIGLRRMARRRFVSVPNVAPVAMSSLFQILSAPGVAPASPGLVPAGGLLTAARAGIVGIDFDQPVEFPDVLTGLTATLRDVSLNATVKVYDLTTDIGAGVGKIQIVNGRPRLIAPAILNDASQYSVRYSAGAFVGWGGQPVAAVADDSLIFTTDAAPTFGGSASSGANQQNYSFAATLAAGKSVIAVFCMGDPSLSGMVVKALGQVCTFRDRVPVVPLVNNFLGFYEIVTPGGTGTIDIETAGPGPNFAFRAAAAWWNVGARTYKGGAVTPSPFTAKPMIVDMNTDPGDVVLAVGHDDQSGVTFTYTGLTQRVAPFTVELNRRIVFADAFSAVGGAPEQFRISSSGVGGDWAAAIRYG